MRVEFSTKRQPTEHIMIENVVAYTQTDREVLIFDVHGLSNIIREEDIEDFSVYGLGE